MHFQHLKKYHTLPTDYETGYLNRKIEEENMRNAMHEERPPPPPSTMPPSSPIQTGTHGLPLILEDANEEADDNMSDSNEGMNEFVN